MASVMRAVGVTVAVMEVVVVVVEAVMAVRTVAVVMEGVARPVLPVIMVLIWRVPRLAHPQLQGVLYGTGDGDAPAARHIGNPGRPQLVCWRCLYSSCCCGRGGVRAGLLWPRGAKCTSCA
jgi:hypothetical protein